MNRMKSYDVPHKGLRNALSQLSLLAAKTNYSNQHEVEQLYKLGENVFKILNIHAADENEVTLAALEQRCAGCSQHDFDDHEQIHLAQDRLEKLLARIYANSKAGQDVNADGEELFLAFSEFHGTYLEHTAEEERVTQPMLWRYFTDEELASHRGKIMAKNPPQTLLIWFRFVIPAQSHNDRVGLLTGFKKMATATFFDEGMQVIKQVLTEKEFDELNKALA
jgi:Hemerythrin HHE cation binding domain